MPNLAYQGAFKEATEKKTQSNGKEYINHNIVFTQEGRDFTFQSRNKLNLEQGVEYLVKFLHYPVKSKKDGKVYWFNTIIRQEDIQEA